MSLTDLPAETLLAIAEYLDWKSLRSLVSTCRQFRMLVPLRGRFYDKVSATDKDYRFPYNLVRAAIRGLHDPFARLLRYVGDVNKLDINFDFFAPERQSVFYNPKIPRSSTSLLHVVSQLADEAFVKHVLDNGADVSLVDGAGKTPLHRAAEHGRVSAARLLIAAGADVNAALGRPTPLDDAVASQNMEMVDLLLKAGADPTIMPETKVSSLVHSPLSTAAKTGSLEMLERLVGATSDRSSKSWPYAFEAAAARDSVSFLEVLLDSGAFFNESALQKAIKEDRVENLRALLGRREKFRLLGARRGPVLEDARSLEAVKTILAMAPEMVTVGSIPGLWSRWFHGPRHLGYPVNGHSLLLPLLLELCSELEGRDDMFAAILHQAVRKGYVPAIRAILTKHPHLVNARDDHGKTPLIIADKCQPHLRMECVQVLVDEFGCDLNAQDNDGRSALHFTEDLYYSCTMSREWTGSHVFDFRHTIVANYLADKGAILDLRDKHGMTPVEHILSKTALGRCAAALIDRWQDLSLIEHPLRTLGLPAIQKSHWSVLESLLSPEVTLSSQPGDISPDELLHTAVKACTHSLVKGKRAKTRFEALMRMLTAILLVHTEVKDHEIGLDAEKPSWKREVPDTVPVVAAICRRCGQTNSKFRVNPFAPMDKKGHNAFTLLKSAWKDGKWDALLEEFEKLDKPVQDGAVIVSLVNKMLNGEWIAAIAASTASTGRKRRKTRKRAEEETA